ncbi:hypothetical protein DL93DRAFT_2091255 [Clavulina sp. PMI_390]|nr:hypothetical protein DL93DRAFT_2091255 [Clavulina sp. PMI_390]
MRIDVGWDKLSPHLHDIPPSLLGYRNHPWPSPHSVGSRSLLIYNPSADDPHSSPTRRFGFVMFFLGSVISTAAGGMATVLAVSWNSRYWRCIPPRCEPGHSHSVLRSRLSNASS